MTVSDSKSLSEVKEIIRKWWSTIQYERKCSSTNEVHKVVNGLPAEIQLQVKELISLEIKNILDKCLVTKNINDIKAACNAINGCFDNFMHATSAVRLKFIEVVYFINFGISECQKMLFMGNHSKSSLLELLHSLSRILILVLKFKRIKNFGNQKTIVLNANEMENSFNIEKEFELFVGLSFNIQKLLIMDNILIDTKNNLAMAAILMREILIPDECNLKEYHEKFVKTIPNDILEECHKINILKFLLCSAIINTWSVNIIDSNSTYIYLKFFISICEKYSSETPIILNTSRTLLLLLKHDSFKEFVNNGNQKDLQKIMASLLSCIFMLLEHPVACVRHSAKDFLHLLSTITLLHPLIIDAVFKLPSDKRSYFISLGALANEIGSRNLIENHKDLPQLLLNALWDPTVVSHVSLALEFVILKDSLVEKNFPEWCETWIVSLLKVLPVVAADIEKLLEKIFKKHPNSILYVTNKWCDPASPEELRYVITALKIIHKQGLLLKSTFTSPPAKEIFIKNENNIEIKENLISEKLLEDCLHQRDDDIRITTFSFLIEAHKSTKPYTENDFKLIKYFLKYNLNNQQPATRQKILGLIRKMLMRFSDSKAALMKSEKNHKDFTKNSNNILLYDQFQEFLVEFCFSNIFIGCNFNRINTVLNILLICFENIKNMHLNFSKIDYYWNKFLIALDSSYEENKELAVTLCKKLDLSLLKANEPETARSLFKKAFSLCTHMEPPDVLTGSSLLRTLMNFPSAKEVLIKNFMEDYSVEDINYCCIKILTQELKEQLLLAKLDLMTAATCGPMYGILFAIRSIFKNVNFFECDGGSNEINKLYLAEWSYILNELVEICFEMCHLVGCVVNSSSPEGHLPINFQTDFDNFLCLNFFEENEKDESETSIKNKVKVNNSKVLSEMIFKNFLNKFRKLDYTIKNSQYDSYETLRSLKLLLKENELLIRKLECEKKDEKVQVNKNDLEIIDQLQHVKVKIKKLVEDLERSVTVIDWPSTAQVILLCAWRSIKEASLYLGDLVSKLPMDIAINSGLISKDTIIKIGEELKILLCEIKHRGAFEHAYVGFTQIVSSLLKCTDKSLRDLPQKWLLEIISEIKSPLEDQKMKLCSTRRSAGLPFLVQAIICSEVGSIKSSSPSSLHTVMNSLLEITENNGLSNSESKIHALNILRALFKHAQLGEHVASYVSRALMTAVRGSRSATWSIRNSSSLLFSSLIIRIFGVARSKDEISKKNRMTSRIFFQRYSELHEFLLSEMELVHSKESEIHGLYPKPSLYLVLLILGRLYPPPTEDPANIDLSEFLPYINMSRRNPTMKIRELGARALVPLIPLDRLINELDNRFSNLALMEDVSQNERHGILLQIKALLIESGDLLTENISRDKEKSWIDNSKWMLEFDLENKKLVPFTTLSTYVKVLHIIFKNHFHLKDEILKLILNVPDIVNFGEEAEGRVSPGKSLFLENLFYLKTDILGYNWLSSGSDSSRSEFFKLFTFMLKCIVTEVQAFSLSILCYVLPNAAADIDNEDFNGVEAIVKDLLIFQKKENILHLRKEILLSSEIMEFLVSALNNENHEYFKRKVIHRLWLSVISSLVLNGYVSTYHFGKTDSYFLRIDFAKSLLKSGDKNLSTSSIICYAVYLMEKIGLNGKSEVTAQHCLELFNILNEFSSEEADIRERLAVAEIFNRFYMNFIKKYLIEDPTIMKIWMIPFKLLADEDSSVRTIASEFVLKMQNCVKEKSLSETILIEMRTLDWPHLPLISLKAQECLLDSYINLLESEHLLNLVIQMMIVALSSIINQERPDVSSKDEFGVFEKGNPNPFCEELALSDLMCDKLDEMRNVIDLEALLRTSLDRHLAEFIANNFYLKSVANTLLEFVEIITTRFKKIESSHNDFSLSQVQIRHLRKALGLREIV